MRIQFVYRVLFILYTKQMPESIQSRLNRIKEEMEEAINAKDDDTYYSLEQIKKELEETLKKSWDDNENE